MNYPLRRAGTGGINNATGTYAWRDTVPTDPDPYAREVSHDPQTPTMTDGTKYASGAYRAIDNGSVAAKSWASSVRPSRWACHRKRRAWRASS